MASILSKRLFYSNAIAVLHLPPHLRTQMNNAPCRQFHATSSRAFGLSALTPAGFLTTLHATGLTWTYVLPVAAVVVRLGTFFVFQSPARRTAQRLALVQPARAALLFAEVRPSRPDIDPSAKLKELKVTMARQWKAERWRLLLVVGQLPVFLAMIESLRKLLGMRQGAWAYLKDLVSAVKNSILSLNPFSIAIQAPVTECTEAVLLSTADPTWTVEGPWWCTDLTALDSTYFLPVAIPLIMLLTATFKTTHKTLPRVSKPGLLADSAKFVKRGVLQRLIIAGCIGMGFVTPHLPAGLLWYWFWSTGTGLVLAVVTDRLMPIPGRKIATRPYPPFKVKKVRRV